MAANTEYTKIKESALSALFSRIKATFWPKDDVTNLDLATVAVSGSYRDLLDKPTVPVESSLPVSGGLLANTFYDVGTLTGTVSITLDTASQVSGEVNIYALSFVAGSTAPNITWTSSITEWAGNCLDKITLSPVITGGKSYEVLIRGGLAVITEFA